MKRKKKIELGDDVMFDKIPMIHRGKGRLSLLFARRYTLLFDIRLRLLLLAEVECFSSSPSIIELISRYKSIGRIPKYLFLMGSHSH